MNVTVPPALFANGKRVPVPVEIKALRELIEAGLSDE
jgi:hypothetical protein